MTDVLLVLAPKPDCYSDKALSVAENSSPPLGLLYLGTMLKDKGFGVAIEDMHAGNLKPEQIIQLIEKHKPKILGISASTPTYPNARKMALLAKEKFPEVKLVLGGVHATALPKRCLEESKFDVVVIGEGELTIVELADFFIKGKGKLNEVKGIAFKDAGGIHFNLPRQFIKDLDSLPIPDRGLIDLSKYSQKGALVSSRGCPAQCIYCACGAFSGRTYRVRSAENLVKEIECLHDEFGITQFEFHDDTFTLFPERVERFCELLKEK
ncbi:cobalamin B12-binding domain-containing protein, partial [archaeon]|nr:cobalamin B12-binding domain-containing protein [archaeon]